MHELWVVNVRGDIAYKRDTRGITFNAREAFLSVKQDRYPPFCHT